MPIDAFPWITGVIDNIVQMRVDLLSFVPATITTINLALTSLFFGLLLAMVFARLELAKNSGIAYTTTAIVTFIRSLPELLIIVSIYNGISILINLFLDGFYLNLGVVKWWIQIETAFFIPPFWCGVISLSLLYAAYAAQTLRGAFNAVPRGQIESAKALCMRPYQIFFRVSLPQIWRFALPGLSNQWLVLLKDTALISLIAVNDIMNVAKMVSNRTYEPFFWYLIAACIYVGITLVSQCLINWLKRRSLAYEIGSE